MRCTTATQHLLAVATNPHLIKADELTFSYILCVNVFQVVLSEFKIRPSSAGLVKEPIVSAFFRVCFNPHVIHKFDAKRGHVHCTSFSNWNYQKKIAL